MRKTTHALAIPAALVLVAGLSACKLPGSTSSTETSTPAPEPTSSTSAAPAPTVPGHPSTSGSTTGGSSVPTVPASSPTPSTKSISVTQLSVGDCFSNPDGASSVRNVDVVDCSAPHQHEVYNTYTITSSTFPSSSEMDDETQTACYDSFTSYVGVSVENSTYSIFTLTPTESSWSMGDRTIKCILAASDDSSNPGEITGSAKDTNK